LSDDKEPNFEDLMKNLFEGLMGSMLQGMTEMFSKLAVLVSAAENHGKDKKDSCAFYRNGVCEYWFWEDEPSGEPFIINVLKEEDGWHIDPHPIYCALCFSYEEKEDEEEEELDEELEDEEWTEEEEELDEELEDEEWTEEEEE